MKKPTVAVVIPNWNGADFIQACINSLVTQSCSSKIFMVDNGSVDSSVALVKKNFSTVTILELPQNTGFTGGVNAGIEQALRDGVDYIALFNNDAVADRRWLEHLVTAAEKHPLAGIITSKFMRDDRQHFDSTGDFYTIWGLPTPRGRNIRDEGQFDKPELVFGATGGASLYRAKMLREIGLFDDCFFAYFEDVDISFRAQLAGWKVWYEPAAIAYHAVGGTSSKLGDFARYHSVKNFITLYVKDMPNWLFWFYLPLFGLQLLRFGVTSLLRGQPLAYLRGVGRALLLMPGTLKKRHHIQKSRKVSIQYIKDIMLHQRPPKPPAIEIVHE